MTATAELSIDDSGLGPPERLHPLYLLTGLGQAVKGVWGSPPAGPISPRAVNGQRSP
jgi:hypothetical protein